MKERRVTFAPEASADLEGLHDWIADSAGPITALDYLERLEVYCREFSLASRRGQVRDDIRPGLRVVGFERRITIAFCVDDVEVTILRIFPSGRDWETGFDD